MKMTLPSPPSSGATSDQPLGLRKRADLVVVQTMHKNESAMVLKDPIAMKYHRLRPDEYFLLEKLGDGATLSMLQREYQDEYCPQKVTLAEINELLLRFHRLGLTISDRPTQGDRYFEKLKLDRRRRMAQLFSSVLFIRFPGVDPEPFLKHLYPIVRPLFTPTGMAAMWMIILAAMLTIAGQWSRFQAEFPTMNEWIQLRAVLLLAAVIGGTKILHELGHATVCKHFGGECHQIGPMLLVFTPALYCDTSDSWMLPNRYARAAVGIAGIGTEILLASIATLVWAFTGASLLHYVAMNVMLVCSISTLLFNANPLLRYDGYYVLSDLCDVPNLGERSRGLLSRLIARILFGVHDLKPDPAGSAERFWLVVYALSAVIYRWALTLFILWLLLVLLRPYRLESLGLAICLFAAAGLMVATLRAPLTFLKNPGKRRMIKRSKLVRSGIGCLVLLVMIWIPIPSGESASGSLFPRSETSIYVSTAGHLDRLTGTPGQVIQRDQMIARLSNPDVEYQYIESLSRVNRQQQLVEALQSSLSTNPEIAAELPVAKTMLSEFRRQLETRKSRREALKIRSPVSGRLIAPPRQPVDPSVDQTLTLTSWTGDPTEERNLGCFIQPGTELFAVVADDLWNAELVLTGSQVQRIEVGNAVKLIVESHPSVPIRGVVTDIALKQWTAREDGHRRDAPNAGEIESTLEVSYAVEVRLGEIPDTLKSALLPGSLASARIEAAPCSILGRMLRFANRLLRIR